MAYLYLDFETYCDLDIKEVGAFKYVSHPSFEVLLASYAVGDGEVVTVTGAEFLAHLPQLAELINSHTWVAHNASFERLVLERYGIECGNNYQDTMTMALSIDLPASLEKVGEALQIANPKKASMGRSLIRYFCTPTGKPARPRNLPHHDKEKWQLFVDYSVADVLALRDVHRILERIAPPETLTEHQVRMLDYKINKRGIAVDQELVENAIKIDEAERATLEARQKELTKLENPNSVAQLKMWLATRGIDAPTLAKGALDRLLAQPLPDDVREVLTIRSLLSLSSVAKYHRLEQMTGADARVRGLFQYWGAHTGRWAGRGVQLHNLPRNDIDIEEAKEIIKSGNADYLNLIYSSPHEVLSQSLRGAFIGDLIVADYSAIEARVLAWLAGEAWQLAVFNGDGQIYEATAARLYNVPLAAVNKDLRRRGKVASLALGYQGAHGALAAMNSDGAIPKEEYSEIINNWRLANPAIVRFWRDVEKAALMALETPGEVQNLRHVRFLAQRDNLYITLPSGRSLTYLSAQVTNGRLSYLGGSKKLARVETYGGRLVENITQAVARDILADAMLALDTAGYALVAHIHDEVVIEKSTAEQSLAEVIAIMCEAPKWAEGLPLAAAGFISKFYTKG